MRKVILINERQEILRGLIRKLSPEDLQNLKGRRPKIWKDFSDDSNWHNKRAGGKYEINARILEILDTKAGIPRLITRAEELSRGTLDEIAEIFGLAVSEKNKSREVIEMILKEILKEKEVKSEASLQSMIA